MAFWSIGSSAFHNVSAVEKVLERKEYTLYDVLAAEDVLQEVMSMDNNVIDYLRQPAIISQLVDIVLGEDEQALAKAASDKAESNQPSSPKSDDGASDDESELEQDETLNEEPEDVDYMKIASEVLSCDAWGFMEALVSAKDSLDRLWGLLDEPAHASTKQLACFTSIIEHLLEKRTDQMLDYMIQLPKFTSYFLRYIDNAPLADLLLKIISTDHPDTPSGIIELLYEQDLIPQLIERLGPDVADTEQVAVGDFLKAFVTISGGNKTENCSIGPNELSRKLVSEECVSKLIEIMLHGGSGMCIAVGVIIEIIRKNNSDYDYVQVLYTTVKSHPPTTRDSIYLGTLVRLFADAIPKFQKVLEKKSDETIEMPLGKIKPLGFERFRICELYAELLHCSSMALLNEPKGEQIVRERDLERKRRFHANEFKESDEKELQTIREGKKGEGWKPESLDEDDESRPSTSVTEKDDDEEPVSPLPQPSSPKASPPSASAPQSPQEMQIDSPAPDEISEAALIKQLAEQEANIRASPVIGDRLKLALDDSGCISTVFSMLVEYPWNNFLHNVVFDIVQQIFNGSVHEGYNKFLAIHLFTRDKITEQIVAGQQSNDEYERERNIRLGYVGHLTLISEEVVKFASVFPPRTLSPGISEALEAPEWQHYVATTLLYLRDQYNTVLGGQKPEGLDSFEEDRFDSGLGESEYQQRLNNDKNDEDEDEDEDDGEESGEDDDQFSRYMNRQLTNAAGHYGSSDDDEDEEWESLPQRTIDVKELENSDDDSGDSSGDDDLSLVRSRSYGH